MHLYCIYRHDLVNATFHFLTTDNYLYQNFQYTTKKSKKSKKPKKGQMTKVILKVLSSVISYNDSNFINSSMQSTITTTSPFHTPF